jgi:hypothetical protein
VGDGENLLTYLNSALKALSGLDIFPHGEKNYILLTSVIYKRLNSYLIENNILPNKQFGFKEKSTTDMATHTLLNNIQLCLNKKKACRWNTL